MSNRKRPEKSYNANIWCAYPGCHAEPWPSDPNIRETFSLLRLGPNGRSADSPSPGEWRCERHLIPQQDLPAKRAPRAAQIEALTDFENLVAAEGARLEEEVTALDGGAVEIPAFATYFSEIARGLASLRKAVQP